MAVESHDRKLTQLLDWVEIGKAQLPDFQRSWVWDDTQICKLIESVTSGFPMGAAMFLAYGGEHIRFKYRTFAGVELDNQDAQKHMSGLPDRDVSKKILF